MGSFLSKLSLLSRLSLLVSPRTICHIGLFWFVGWHINVGAVLAQETDSLALAPTDSVIVADSAAIVVPELPPVGFLRAEPGLPVDSVFLVLAPELDAQGVLGRLPGTFVYDFGTPGWPDAWSRFGLSPNKVTLALNGIPFTNTITGRPRFDVLPLAYLEPLRVTEGRYGAPVVIHGIMRPFDSPRPITELRYRQSNTGLQAISVMHAQQRRRSLFGRQGVMGLQFGYRGMESEGEYPGSEVTLGPQSYFRLRYEQRPWSLEVGNFHSRRIVGAHSGVVPFISTDYNTIYQRFGANVSNQSAERRAVRNDFYVTTRVRLMPRYVDPFTATVYRTREQFRYRNPNTDTLQAKTDRIGFRTNQNLTGQTHRMQLRAEGWVDRVRSSNVLPDSISLTQRALHLSVLDSIQVGPVHATANIGWHTTTLVSFPSFAFTFGASALRLRLSQTGEPLSRIEARGWGSAVLGASDLQTPIVRQGQVDMHVHTGLWDARITGFFNETRNGTDLYETGLENVLEVGVTTEPQYRGGIALDLGWRRASTRGWYITLQPTWTRFLNPNESTLHQRLAGSHPEVYVQGRLGFRYLLFQDDLDLHMYLKGRVWSEMNGRTFHPQTGLLAVPQAGARQFGTNGTVDIQVEAGIRTATVFVAYENFTAGTTFHVGNLHIPDYPLPRRRFRLGVFWPIFD